MLSKIIATTLFVFLISGCATQPKYDINAVAEFVGERSKLGAPIKAAKCSLIQALTGETEGTIRYGLCIAFNKAFVYRAIDINEPFNGNSIVYHHATLTNAGVTLPSLLGLRQLLLTTNVSANAFTFRPIEGLGYDNEMAYEFLNILTSKNVREINEPKALSIESSGGTIYIYTPVRKKK
jgi:hypothetical protein